MSHYKGSARPYEAIVSKLTRRGQKQLQKSYSVCKNTKLDRIKWYNIGPADIGLIRNVLVLRLKLQRGYISILAQCVI